MKNTPIRKFIIASSIALTLAACGGGGGGGGSSATPPAATNPTDPITGNPTTGTGTNTVTGVVYAAATSGATVSAYNVLPDGSNGALLGTSTATGADGRFSISLNGTPGGMVRFIASGGTFKSEADATNQPVDTLELVAPYVTTELNKFVITPVTHMASRALAYQAKNGATLTSAYTAAMNTALSLSGTNAALPGDSRRIVNILATEPNSAGDTGHAYQDLLTGLEWFGVKYDLPSRVVFRIAAENAESGFGPNGVNGAGSEINVGAWIGNLFDVNQVRTVNQLLELPKADPSAPTLHDNIKSIMSIYIIRDFYLDAACKDATRQADTLARYPDLAGLFGSGAEAGACTGAADRIAALQTSAATNKRGTLMK